MRFACDEMLGRLARDLRFLGFDTTYAHSVDDTTVLADARRSGRRLLTRDRDLAARAGPDGYLITSTDPDVQLDDVMRGLAPPVEAALFLSRCTSCNALLVDVPVAEVADQVPPEIADADRTVRRCPGCAHVYWEGSHVADIRRRLARHLPSQPDDVDAGSVGS